MTLDSMDTLQAALRSQPETRRVVVVGGTSGIDQRWLAEARAALAGAPAHLELMYLTDLPVEASWRAGPGHEALASARAARSAICGSRRRIRSPGTNEALRPERGGAQAMPSIFNARDADSYEQVMGRWSRRLAPLFIEHAGAGGGERLLEVGCGTGSLTFTLAGTVAFEALTAIDYAEVYVAATRARNRDPRIHIEHGDAAALRFPDAHFDRALSLLVLHFVPEPAGAVAEMRRVTRPGGVVAAAVWDSGGGLTGQRMFWDTAAMLDTTAADLRGRAMSKAVVGPGGLARLFRAAGLADVDERSLLIRMEHADFADYWEPLLRGEGPTGSYVAGLGEAERARLERHLRAAYLAGAPDGPRSFAAVAWSCRGVVPHSPP